VRRAQYEHPSDKCWCPRCSTYKRILQKVDAIDIDKRADVLTEQMYIAFGSDTGILFGIPCDCRKAVRAVIKQVLIETED
jgi:hypothetical protein